MVETLFAEQVVHLYRQGDCQPIDLVLAMLDALYHDPENEMQLVMMDLWLSMRGDDKLTDIVGPVFYQGSANLWRCFEKEEKDKFDTLANLARTFITGLSVNRLNPAITPAMARGQIKLMRKLIQSALDEARSE